MDGTAPRSVCRSVQGSETDHVQSRLCQGQTASVDMAKWIASRLSCPALSLAELKAVAGINGSNRNVKGGVSSGVGLPKLKFPAFGSIHRNDLRDNKRSRRGRPG